MKPLVLPLLALFTLAGCRPHAAESPAPAAPQTSGGATNVPAAATAAPTSAAVPATAAPGETIPIAVPEDLPAPVADVVRLAQSAVDEAVVLSFAERLPGGFDLTADHIIYLADVGVPSQVIQVLIAKSVAEPSGPETAGGTNAPVAAVPAPAPVPVAPAASLTPAEAPPPVYGQPQPGPAPSLAQAAAPAAVAPPVQNVTYNVFHESLSPYGSWVQVSGYGWCWRPTVAVVNTGWRPYCDDGWWVWSDYGWYWHSTYSWGWAPFHYGRWCQTPGFGWVWSPGTVWGPAWVAWRSSDAYCGWAPLPPQCHWSASVGFTWTDGGVSVGVGFGIASEWWVTTGWSNFTHRRLRSVCLPPRDGHRALGRSEINVGRGNVVNINGDNNTVIINDGVPREEVQRRTRSEVPKVALTDAAAPGVGGARGGAGRGQQEIAVYRPRLDAAGRVAAPAGVSAARPGTASGAAPRPVSGLVPSRNGLTPAARPDAAAPGRPDPSAGVKASEPARSPAPRIGPAPAPNRTFAHEDPSPASRPGPAVTVPSRPGAPAGGGQQVVPNRPAPAPAVGAPSRPAPAGGPAVPSRPAPSGGQVVPAGRPGGIQGTVPARPVPSQPAAGPATSTRSIPGADVGRPGLSGPASFAPRGEASKGVPAAAPGGVPAGTVIRGGTTYQAPARPGAYAPGTASPGGVPAVRPAPTPVPTARPAPAAPQPAFRPPQSAVQAPPRSGPVTAAPAPVPVARPAARPQVSPSSPPPAREQR